MLTNVNIFLPNLPQLDKPEFICDTCHFKSGNRKDYKRHLNSKKHNLKSIVVIEENDTQHDIMMTCKCGKKYKSRQGFYLHKKKCNIQETIESKGITVDMVMTIIQQNQEFKDKLFELASKPTIINNTKNVQNNKQFNLNIFLNETCKNAMNLSDFVFRYFQLGFGIKQER